MSKQLREMLNSIATKKVAAKALVAENKLEDAKTAMAEIKELQAKAEMLAELEADEADEDAEKVGNGQIKPIENKKDVNAGHALVNAIKNKLIGTKINEEEMEILAMMKEGSPSDGGLTVPQDISTQIKELRRSEDALENLVNVEPVATESGSRVIEVNADHVPFDNVEEAAEFPECETPEFANLTYKVKKKGGILKVTRELLQDTSENILGYLRRWIAKKAKTTRNMLILAKLNEICKTSAVITGLDDIKKVFNITLDPAIALTSIVLTNQDGFNWLDTIKDSDGDYILQPNPVDATKKLLFGKYPIHVVSNKTLKTTSGKAPLFFGDLKQAITIFDRENLSIELSTEAGDLWAKDLTGVKVRERLDIQAVDTEAVVKGEVTLP